MGRKSKLNINTGIQSRIISNFGIVILLLVTIIEITLIIGITNYYYGGVEQILRDRITVSSDFLNSYSNYSSVDTKARLFFETSSNTYNNSFLVQFIDLNKNLVLDSNGFSENVEINTVDVNAALENKPMIYRGKNSANQENIMAVSRPLIRYGNIDGAIRFIVSLEKIEKEMQKLISFSIIIGLIFIGIFILISAFVSNTIVKPIKKLNEVAEEFAKGNFKAKAEKIYNDEVGVLADTMNFMADEIKNTDKIKNDFISSISHELRTPLTSIKGWSETLQYYEQVKKDSDIALGLSIISTESERLQNMVEELLDFSRFQSNRMKMKKKPIDVKKVITQIYKQFSNKRSSISLMCNLTGEDTCIYADSDRLKQVYINLVSNAIKFTPDGGSIELSAVGYEDKIVTSVKDTGIGIKQDEIPKITQKFYKLSSSIQGNGLGLSIVDEIVRLHDAKMEIVSEEGKGSEFIITFPAYKEDTKGEELIDKNINLDEKND